MFRTLDFLSKYLNLKMNEPFSWSKFEYIEMDNVESLTHLVVSPYLFSKLKLDNFTGGLFVQKKF